MKVMIFGASGMVGQSVLRQALQADDVGEVAVVVRKPLPQQHAKLRQIIAADLGRAQAELAQLCDFDGCFYCVGVTSGGMNEADYRAFTHDMTLAVADALLPHNPKLHFVYISGAGADSSEQGKTMWAWVRGATENALLKRGFAQLNNFRPAFIEPIGVQSQTASYRWMYRLMTPFFPLINRFSASALTSVQLGNAMLNAVRFNENRPVLEAAEIRALGERRA